MPRPGDLVDALSNPGESIRALGERASWLESLGLPPDPEALAKDRGEVEAGAFSGAIWIGPKDEAAALVRFLPSGPKAREARPFLLPGYRSIGALRALLARIEASGGIPVAIYRIEGAALPPSEVGAIVEPWGFRRIERFDMQFARELPLPAAGEPIEGLRPVGPADEGGLGDLLYDAYADFPLDPALFGDGTDRAGAAAAIRQLLDGTYGPSSRAASWVVERAGRIVGAVLVNDFHGPLIAEVMVAPDHRRQGLARALILESVRATRRDFSVPPRLVVTAVNYRARRLYESLGFTLVPLPPDSTWLSLARRGLPELTSLLPSSR